ncbi:hypothetical protein FO519_008866 [Halicephalobus sp. NKZ332]|nr:hypothetical protein FO519_008866 [Halicephalobus sp. NKZ332]
MIGEIFFLSLVVIPKVFGSPEFEMEAGLAGLRHCGGGPFSSFWANLVSIPCDSPSIDNCCFDHDRCYESPFFTQEACDSAFCSCLEEIPSNMYCATFAQPGLCLATKVFGHQFHWSSQCDQTDFQENPEKESDESEDKGSRNNCLIAARQKNYSTEL